jgi:hypothetical protein
MMLESELPVGLLDIGLIGIVRNPQDFVIISLGHILSLHSSCKRILAFSGPKSSFAFGLRFALTFPPV